MYTHRVCRRRERCGRKDERTTTTATTREGDGREEDGAAVAHPSSPSYDIDNSHVEREAVAIFPMHPAARVAPPFSRLVSSCASCRARGHVLSRARVSTRRRHIYKGTHSPERVSWNSDSGSNSGGGGVDGSPLFNRGHHPLSLSLSLLSRPACRALLHIHIFSLRRTHTFSLSLSCSPSPSRSVSLSLSLSISVLRFVPSTLETPACITRHYSPDTCSRYLCRMLAYARMQGAYKCALCVCERERLGE